MKIPHALKEFRHAKLHFRCILDKDPAAECDEEWFVAAKWVKQRWGYKVTQSNYFFFLGVCYLSW